ncbi:MAG: FGGY family carbohydrate kinase [Comamonadaceae bacterium]|nr:FGGY family carbohydrate kinase [Comamonadaceae bacterium]
MPDYAVGIDSGTQGTKALVVDVGDRPRPRPGPGPHAMVDGPRPGSERAGPGGLDRAARKALAAALKESRIDPDKVASIGVSGQQHGFVPLDAAGKVIRPAKLWNDTSTISENEDIVAALGGVKAAISRLGIAPAVGFTASKILWLKRHEPKKFARLATVLLPHNYLNFWLDGPGPHGIRRRLRHRADGRPPATVGRGGRGRRRSRSSPRSCRPSPSPRARRLRDESRWRTRSASAACSSRRAAATT